MEINEGTNIFFVDKDSMEDAPVELKFANGMAKDIVSNTWDGCDKYHMTPSLLPSAYLQAFKMVIPSILKSIERDANDNLKSYVDGQILGLNLAIKSLENYKAKK